MNCISNGFKRQSNAKVTANNLIISLRLSNPVDYIIDYSFNQIIYNLQEILFQRNLPNSASMPRWPPRKHTIKLIHKFELPCNQPTLIRCNKKFVVMHLSPEHHMGYLPLASGLESPSLLSGT